MEAWKHTRLFEGKGKSNDDKIKNKEKNSTKNLTLAVFFVREK